MTGATVSSRAVTGVVYKIDRTFIVNRKEIIKELSKAEK
jgi:Na+-translocating ferredoxin:NAD+ oxidoreductase RnfG subunit